MRARVSGSLGGLPDPLPRPNGHQAARSIFLPPHETEKNVKQTASIIAAALFLFTPLAFADNGVERGEIPFDGNSAPVGIQRQVRDVIRKNCDLTGAAVVRTGYVEMDRSQLGSGHSEIGYKIQYAVIFPNHSVLIYVAVTLDLDLNRHSELLKIESLDSPICRSFP